jgi:hypothetical protein
MSALKIKSFVFCLVSVAIVTLGFVPVANAGVVTTAETISASDRDARISDITSLLARADVAEQLIAYGVDPADVSSRLAGLSDNEIALLHQNIETQIAGGDALGIIGGVFLILIILELVGVIDIFKAT